MVAAFRDLRATIPEAALELIDRTPGVTEPGVTDGWIDMRTPEGLDRLLAAFHRATCFVMPSRFEPFAIVHAELASRACRRSARPSAASTRSSVPAV